MNRETTFFTPDQIEIYESFVGQLAVLKKKSESQPNGIYTSDDGKFTYYPPVVKSDILQEIKQKIETFSDLIADLDLTGEFEYFMATLAYSGIAYNFLWDENMRAFKKYIAEFTQSHSDHSFLVQHFVNENLFRLNTLTPIMINMEMVTDEIDNDYYKQLASKKAEVITLYLNNNEIKFAYSNFSTQEKLDFMKEIHLALVAFMEVVFAYFESLSKTK